MAEGFLWKPSSQGQRNPGGLSFLIPPRMRGKVNAASVVDKQGNIIERLQGNSQDIKFWSSKPGASFGNDIRIRLDIGDGQKQYINIPKGAERSALVSDLGPYYAGPVDLENAKQLSAEASSNYTLDEGGGGGGGGGGSGIPPGFAPGNIGYGSFGAYVGDQYPTPAKVNYKPIKQTPYQFTDPTAFAQAFGNVNRGEYAKNFGQAQQFALDTLHTELQGLQGYVPAAAALKRGEISADNQFNQQQRSQQVEQALPGVTDQLNAQGQRADIYAQGKVPDALMNSALELGVRSQAADAASAGGFGAASSVSRKVSDLMSATQRLQIAQYGEQLTGQNINAKAGLLLAPTEYSNAGGQVNVMPSLSASQLTAQNLSELNQLTTLNPAQALQTIVQQNQFKTSLGQQTAMFNAGNAFSASQINAAAANQFAQNLFAYKVGFAGAVAGAAQTNTNTGLALQQQQQYMDIYKDALSKTQDANTIQSIVGAAGAAIAGLGQLFGSQNKQQAQPTTQSSGGGVGSGMNGNLDYGSTTGGGNTQQTPSSFNPDINSSTPDITMPAFSNAGTSEAPSAGPQTGTGISGDVQLGPDTSGGGASLEPLSYTAKNASYTPGASGGGSPAVSFASATGIPTTAATTGGLDVQSHQQVMDGINKALGNSAPVINQQTGGSTTPQAGYVPVGSSRDGTLQYASANLANNNDTTAGQSVINGLHTVVDPFGVLDKKDSGTIDAIGLAASDIGFIDRLNQQYQNGDTQGFLNSILNQYKKPLIDKIAGEAKSSSQEDIRNNFQNKEGLSMAIDAYNLYNNWGTMSGARKALGLATVGIKGWNSATGENLNNLDIIKPTLNADNEIITPGLKLGQAIGLLGAGVNVYSLAKNWDQMSNIARATQGTATLANLVTTARSMGLLGTGTTGAQVAVDGAQIANAGYKIAPYAGNGALTGPASAATPKGFTQTGTLADGSKVVVPQGLEQSATSLTTQELAQGTTPFSEQSLGTQVGGAAQLAGGVAGIAAGAYQVYEGWGQGGTKGAINGALGGAAISAGLYAVGTSSALAGTAAGAAAASASTGPAAPFVFAAIMATAILGDAIQAGKSTDQKARDGVRSVIQKNGLMDANHNATLADGTKVDLGIDGHGGLHDPAHPEYLTGGNTGSVKGNKMNSWDIDYTNDLDYAAGMGGVALSRLLTGGSNKEIDQVGSQIGNASIGNIGYGKDMSVQNFSKMTQNLRSMYAKAGINSKTDAYALTNQAYGEGRINETQAISMHQAFNMIFDQNGYDTAARLMTGRWTGIQNHPKNIAKVGKNRVQEYQANQGKVIPTSASAPSASAPSAPTKASSTTQIAQNQPFYLRSQQKIGSTFDAFNAAVKGGNEKMSADTKLRLMNITKDQAKARNKAVYGASA